MIKKILILSVLIYFTGVVPLQAASPVIVTDAMIEQAAALQKRQEAVSLAEKKLAARRLELDALQKDIDTKLKKLKEMQQDIVDKIAYIEGLNIRDKEFRNLIKIYSAMSGSKLAPILDKLADENVAHILRAMKAADVAKIVPKLDADKAVRVSRLLGMLPD